MRIDLFYPPKSQYGVLQSMTHSLCDALNREGAICRILEAKSPDPEKFLKELLSEKPDCTLSFNGLLPDQEGNFFCDMIEIPHVALLLDSPLHFTSLTKSARNIIACADRWSERLFKETGFKNVFFLPHAAEQTLLTDPSKKRGHESVMLSSCIDYLAIEEEWKKNYPKRFVDAFYASCTSGHYFDNFMEAIGGPSKAAEAGVNLVLAIDSLEQYLRGRDRVELIRSLTEVPVDLFGSGPWEKYVGEQKNVTLHDAVPFDEALIIMKNSRIVLNSCSWITDGAHERIFSGTLTGASIVTSQNPYLTEFPMFIEYNEESNLNEQVKLELDDEEKRVENVLSAQKIVLEKHTFDARAKQLLHDLPRFLPS